MLELLDFSARLNTEAERLKREIVELGGTDAAVIG